MWGLNEVFRKAFLGDEGQEKESISLRARIYHLSGRQDERTKEQV